MTLLLSLKMKRKGVGLNLNFKRKSSYKRMRCLINLNTPISKSFFGNTLANSINKHATSIDWKNDKCITERWKRSRTCSGNIVNIFSNLSDCFAGYTSAISRHSCLTVNKVFKDTIRKVSQWMSSKLTWVPTSLVGQAFKTWPLPSKSTTSYSRSSANSGPNMSVATRMIFPRFNFKLFFFHINDE